MEMDSMIVLMDLVQKQPYEHVSQIACVCVSFFLVLNIYMLVTIPAKSHYR
jgi:hypothetical protein